VKIKPHLSRTFKMSNDKRFEEKFWDVIGSVRSGLARVALEQTGGELTRPVRSIPVCA
jgi:hypothetical protein